MPTEGYVDVVVIGGGPGGYVAAVRAAQLGGRVILVEKEELGGTCANRGCIPTKALLEIMEFYSMIKQAEHFGIAVQGASPRLDAMIERKNAIVRELVKGIDYLLKRNGVQFIKGTGRIASPESVQILNVSGDIVVKTKSIVIATGSEPAKLPIPNVDSAGVITSSEALDLREVPKSILIVGGGAVGLEFASIFSELGSETTVVEMMPHILPNEDEEIASTLEKILRKKGIAILTKSKVISISGNRDGIKAATLLREGKEVVVQTEKILVATGRSPNIHGLNAENIGVKIDKGAIVVNNRMETSVLGIYAVGDVVGKFMLAHVAMAEGTTAAENALGKESYIDYKVIPRCTYTSPEVACVGLPEGKAQEQGYDVVAGKFPLVASGRAATLGERSGLVKIVCDKNSREILGVHMIAPHASELIHEATLAMKLEATVDDVASLIHAHPTLAEAIKEAALDVDRKAVHNPR